MEDPQTRLQEMLPTMTDEELLQILAMFRVWEQNGGADNIVTMLGSLISELEAAAATRGLAVPEV